MAATPRAPGKRAARRRWEAWAAVPVVLLLLYLELVQVRQLVASADVTQRSFAAARSSVVSPCWGAAAGNTSQCFTVLVSHLNRRNAARGAARYYRSCSRVAEVRVSWAEPGETPSFGHLARSAGAPVVVANRYPDQSLHGRFLLHGAVSTRAVFTVDDDVRVRCEDIHAAHDAWLAEPRRMVGIFPRHIAAPASYQGYTNTWWAGAYSVVLPKAAVIPVEVLRSYASNGTRQRRVRDLVAHAGNCEDIAVQFAAAELYPDAAPLFLPPKHEVVDYGSWMFGIWLSGFTARWSLSLSGARHMASRSACVEELVNIYGAPLPTSRDSAGGRPWRPANGWEWLSADLWAPALRTPALVLWAFLAVLAAARWRACTGTSAARRWAHPAVVERANMCSRKLGRAGVVAVAVVLWLYVVDCCLLPSPPALLPRNVTHPAVAGCTLHPPVAAERRAPLPDPLDGTKLRVAVFTGVYSAMVDGVALTMNRMVAELEGRGHTVRVFSPDPADEISPRGVARPVGRRVQTSTMSAAVFGKPGYHYGYALGAHAAAALEEFAPDVVHSASPDGAAKDAQAWARGRGVPFVCSYHTRFNAYFHFYGPVVGLLEHVFWWTVRDFYNGCTQMLPPTEYVRDELQANGVTTPATLWPRGIEPEKFHPRQRCGAWRAAYGASDGAPVVLFASRLVLEKNLRVLVAVIQALERAGVPHRSVIVGDGRDRAATAAALPNTVFVGRTSPDELATTYASSDVFFFPSLTETFGNVVLEAMASGLPVVGANASGTSALVAHNTTGVLVDAAAPDGGVGAFTDALTHLLAAPELRRQMGRAGHARAASFSWDEAFHRLYSTYHDVVTHSRAS